MSYSVHNFNDGDVLTASQLNEVDTQVDANATKLETVEEGANKITVDSALSGSSTNPVQNKVINESYTALKEDLDECAKESDLYGKSFKSRTQFIDLGDAIENAVIKDDGSQTAGTGSGRNWITDFIKLPKNKDIRVISQLCSYYIALYDSDKAFLKMAAGSSSATEKVGIADFSVTDLDGAVYMRIGFYDYGGYTDEKYSGTKIVFYSDEYVNDSEKIEDSIPWSMTVYNDNSMSAPVFSEITVGTSGYVTFDSPVLITLKDTSYKMCIAWVSDDFTKKIKSWWFGDLDLTNGVIIPPDFKFYIGIRNSASDNTIRFTDDVLDLISISEIDKADKNQMLTATFVYNNGVVIVGPRIGRIGTASAVYTNKNLLVHVKNDAQYTLCYHTGETIDYSGTWTKLYSVQGDTIIPAGSWYVITVALAGEESAVGCMFDSLIELIELPETESYKNLADSIFGIESKLASISKRLSNVENDGVPTYYEDHIKSKVSTLNALSGSRFAFITDTHINGYSGNTMHSRALLTYLCENVKIPRVFNGGDMFNAGKTGLTYPQTVAVLNESANYTQPDAVCEQYFVVGNHDCGWDYYQKDGSTVTVTGNIDGADFIKSIGSHINDVKVMIDPNSYGTQYYFDDDEQGIRYVVSNGGTRDVGVGEGYGDSWYFIAKAFLTTPKNYKIVLFLHIVVSAGKTTLTAGGFPEALANMIDSYNSRGTSSYSGKTINFEKALGKAICFIGGHTHIDLTLSTTNGIPIIITTTDNYSAEYSTSTLERTAGTVTEQAFDVFTIDVTNSKIYVTRIGAGEDREFSY